MTKQPPKRSLYLTVDEALEVRIQVAYAAALRKRKESQSEYPRTAYLETLVRYALDQQDDIVGSKAALANRVGDRIDARLNNIQIVLMALLRLFETRIKVPDAEVRDILVWAVEHSDEVEKRIALLHDRWRMAEAQASAKERQSTTLEENDEGI